MKLTVYEPSAPPPAIVPLPVNRGGTGTTDPVQAAINLGLLTNNTINQPEGPFGLDPASKVDPSVITGKINCFGMSLNFTGPILVNAGTLCYISGFDSVIDINVRADRGSINNGNDIPVSMADVKCSYMFVYVGPATPGPDTITVNGRKIIIEVTQPAVTKPGIIYPTNGQIDVTKGVTVIATAFESADSGDTHQSSDWELASDAAFTNVIIPSYNDTTNLTSIAIPGAYLQNSTTYYARVRYNGSVLGLSEWSDGISFTIEAGAPAVDITETLKLISPDFGVSHAFGSSVSISGDGTRLAVGCMFATPLGAEFYTASGAVYIFVKNGIAWDYEAKLEDPIPTVSDTVGGYNLTIDATGTRVSFSSNNGVYVFVRVGTVWTLEYFVNKATYINAGSNNPTIAFSLAGDQLFVSFDNTYLLIFSRTGTTWTEVYNADITGTANGRITSISINTDASVIVIANRNYSNNPGTIDGSGAVHVLLWNGVTCTQTALIEKDVPGNNEYFGGSAVISPAADRLLINVSDNSGNSSPYCNVYRLDTGVWVLEQTLLNHEIIDPGSDSVVGSGFNADGSKIVMLCPMNIVGGEMNGAVYTYTRVGTTWTYECTYIPSTLSGYQMFGYSASMTLNGDTLVIGAMYDGYNMGTGSPNGAVYTYDLTIQPPTGDHETYKLLSPDTDNEFNYAIYMFGYGLSASSDKTRIAISGGEFDPVTSNPVGVYVYVLYYNGTAWIMEAKLSSPFGINANDPLSYGGRLQLNADGSMLVVSDTLGLNGAVVDAGAAVVYTRSGSTWTQEVILGETTPVTGARFGTTVSLSVDSTYLAIADRDTDGLVASNVTIYKRVTGTWVEDAVIVTEGVTSGIYITLNGDGSLLAVGANRSSPGSLNHAGSVYVYGRTGATWTLLKTIIASDTSADMEFGTSLTFDLLGNTLVVSAVGVSGLETVYVYATVNKAWDTTCTESALLRSSTYGYTGVGKGMMYGYSVALSQDGNMLVISEPMQDYFETSNPNYGGMLYIYRKVEGVWTFDKYLMPAVTLLYGMFGMGHIDISADMTMVTTTAPYDGYMEIGIPHGSLYIFNV